MFSKPECHILSKVFFVLFCFVFFVFFFFLFFFLINNDMVQILLMLEVFSQYSKVEELCFSALSASALK